MNLTMMILRKLTISVLAKISKLVLKKFVYLETPELNVSALKIVRKNACKICNKFNFGHHLPSNSEYSIKH